MMKNDRAWSEVNLNALHHNVAELQRAMKNGCELMAVVKCEAYGHGGELIADALQDSGVTAFAVATVDEGICLRQHYINGDILILGYTAVERAREISRYDLMQTIVDYEYAQRLNATGIRVKTHIKLDSGMHRLGLPVDEIEQIADVFSMTNLDICGIYTHLCRSDGRDEESVAFTKKQISDFYGAIDTLKAQGFQMPKVHIQSSYGLLNYPDLACDYARIGIALYGILSQPDENTVLKLNLQPVLSLKSRIALIRKVKKGEAVGYDGSFIAQRDTTLAVLPIGYGDGYPRSLSNGIGMVEIRQTPAPVVGRICMDQMTVDITDIPDAQTGDIAVLLSAETQSILSAPNVAEKAGTISNELLSRLGTRLKTVIVHK